MDYTAHGILQARILEWVAFPFSRGYSRPWDRTQVSCIAGRCFNLWATRDAWKWKWKCSVVSNSLQPHRLHSPWNSPGQNTEVDSLSLLREIFPTQGSNWGLPHCRQIIYQLSHKGKPKYTGLYSPADLPNPGTEPASPALVSGFFATEPPEPSFWGNFFSFFFQRECQEYSVRSRVRSGSGNEHFHYDLDITEKKLMLR